MYRLALDWSGRQQLGFDWPELVPRVLLTNHKAW